MRKLGIDLILFHTLVLAALLEVEEDTQRLQDREIRGPATVNGGRCGDEGRELMANGRTFCNILHGLAIHP